MKPIKTYLHRLGVCFLFATFLFSKTSTAQTAPPIQWKTTFGGTSWDEPLSIINTTNRGFLIGGVTGSKDIDIKGSHGAYEALVIQLDSNGKIQWHKCFGGAGNEYVKDIIATKDGNYLFVGTADKASGDVTKVRHNTKFLGATDIWVAKISNTGSLLWEKSYGGINNEISNKVIQTSDGGYVFVGLTQSNDDDVSGHHGTANPDINGSYIEDAWVVKIDSVGNIKWQKCVGGTKGDLYRDLIETTDGGLMLIGATSSKDGDVNKLRDSGDVWVLKMDSIGNVQWNKTYGGTNIDGGHSIIKNVTGGYVFGGTSRSADGDVSTTSKGLANVWVVGIDDTGKVLWDRVYGGSQFDDAFKIIQTPDSGLVIGGKTNSNDTDISVNKGNNDWWIIRLDKAHNLKWEKTFGTVASDQINVMTLTTDGYVLAGYMADNSGDLQNNHKGMSDIVVIKLKENFKPTSVEETLQDADIKVYPSPTSGLVNIELSQGYENAKLKVYNMMGKLLQANVTQHGAKRTIDLSSFASGTYTIQVIHDGVQQSFKVINQQ